jgi:EAL domain-containing protein (putative c-di-GMP-specific phosphodiesterase class I)
MAMTSDTTPATKSVRLKSDWYLIEKGEHAGTEHSVNINANPFRIGRLSDLSLSLPVASISKLHAEIILENGSLIVRDLGSTNGTFINGNRICEPSALGPDDLLQLATLVFRVAHRRSTECSRTLETGAADCALALGRFDNLLNHRSVVPHYQPIVDLSTSEPVGFEMLARSQEVGLEMPRLMFWAAEMLDQECTLSEMLRVEGVRAARALPDGMNLFMNTHPHEIGTQRFANSIVQLRRDFPGRLLTIEIHEAAVTDRKALIEFRSLLDDLEIRLAFDDFGAGQARLIELTETSPDYVKFDIELIRGIDRAGPRRQQTLATLVRMVRDLGIATLAEGTETREEAETCLAIGFDLAQGFHFGRPAPLDGRRLAAVGASDPR